MRETRMIRAAPVILGGAGAFAGGAYAQGSTPVQAAGAGLFIALASLVILAALLMIRQMGRATRHGNAVKF